MFWSSALTTVNEFSVSRAIAICTEEGPNCRLTTHSSCPVHNNLPARTSTAKQEICDEGLLPPQAAFCSINFLHHSLLYYLIMSALSILV